MKGPLRACLQMQQGNSQKSRISKSLGCWGGDRGTKRNGTIGDRTHD